ncbi:MAG: TolC family protein, partial [Planctomycetaceae bacterium]|nr:TolC family protein [Planctomycetaceae bacterium]
RYRLSERQEYAAPIAQAEARIYEASSRVKGSLVDVLDREARLRRLLGLPLSDGKFVTPADHPSAASLDVQWDRMLNQALAHRPELRRQKFEIRSLELQLSASENLAHPRLDLVSQYRVNGFGDQLFGNEDDDGVTSVGYRSGYESIAQGHNTTWNLGLSLSVPVGLRQARVQVRNYELRLAKARMTLDEQEKEVAFELNSSLLNMQRWHKFIDDSIKRSNHVTTYANAITSRTYLEDRPDPSQLAQVLEATIQQRDADEAYLRSLVEYNKAIVDVHFRQGILLRENAVYLAEGEWNPEAYEGARLRAWDRTYAHDNLHLQTEPAEFIGGYAPSAWESTGAAERPHMLQPVTPEETERATTVPSVPDLPVERPVPAPQRERSYPNEVRSAPDTARAFNPGVQPASWTGGQSPADPADPAETTGHSSQRPLRVTRLPDETAARVPMPNRTPRSNAGADTLLDNLFSPGETNSPSTGSPKLPSRAE